jgi:hypothetical protein
LPLSVRPCASRISSENPKLDLVKYAELPWQPIPQSGQTRSPVFLQD